MDSSIKQVRLSSFRQPNRHLPARGRQASDHGNIITSSTPATGAEDGGIIKGYEIESFKEGVIELTKNAKYCVSKLPGAPPIVKGREEVFDGVTDQTTSFALVQSDRGSFVWNYLSPDHAPNTLAFTDDRATGSSLAVLVHPSSGSLEPGLYMIDVTNGKSTFWESVGGAVADGLLHRRKGIQHQVPLYGGEEIENIQNVEPAGVVVTTTNGRFILVTLRDQFGKPKVNNSTMYGSGSGFLNSFSVAARFSGTQRDIVSIKPAAVIGRTERQVLFINSNADLSLWECSRTGFSRKLLNERLRETLISSIEGVYSDARKSFQAHDVEIHEQAKYIFVLASFLDTKKTNALCYIVYSLTVNAEGKFQVFSAHRLQTYSSPSTQPPKLLLPQPHKTLFAVFSNAVVLLDSVPEKLSNGVYTRWEDCVSFRQDTEIIGAGIEDVKDVSGKITRNSGIILIADKYGVIRIERYADQKRTAVSEVDPPANQEEVMAKSKIEQAVFYGEKESNPIDFVAKRELTFQPDALEKAALQVSQEILTTTSAYMPPVFPSLSEHLNLRVTYLGRLASYLRSNFPDALSVDGRYQLLWDLEKASSARALWDYADYLLQRESKTNVLLAVANSMGQGKDVFRDWFVHQVADIDKLLIATSQYSQDKKSLEVLINTNDFLIRGIYIAALEKRAGYLESVYGLDAEQDHSVKKPWTSRSKMISTFEKQYEMSRDCIDANSGEARRELSTQLVLIVETLCALHSERIQWYKHSEGPSNNFEAEFIGKRGDWLRLLVDIGEKQAALQIAEKYHIYRALAEIVGEDWRLSRLSGNSQEKSRQQIAGYFNVFGYQFAKVQYQYWVDTQQLKVLLTELPEYRNFLDEFFADGKHSTISWITDIEAGNYGKAGKVLAQLGASNNDDFTSNKQIQLSIAKLCVLANSNTDVSVALEEDQDMMNHEEDDELLDGINFALEEVETQQNLLQQSHLADAFGGAIVDSLHKKGLEGLAKVLERATLRIEARKSLAPNEIIDLLTLLPVDPVGESRYNFVRALQLAAHDPNEESRKVNEKLIWRRLFSSDDWELLEKTKNKSDAKMQSTTQNTVLYKTLEAVLQYPGSLSDFSVELLSTDPIKAVTEKISVDELTRRYTYSDSEGVQKVQADIETEAGDLKQLAAKYNISDWVKGIFSRLQM